jgi:hypothetical protein
VSWLNDEQIKRSMLLPGSPTSPTGRFTNTKRQRSRRSFKRFVMPCLLWKIALPLLRLDLDSGYEPAMNERRRILQRLSEGWRPLFIQLGSTGRKNWNGPDSFGWTTARMTALIEIAFAPTSPNEEKLNWVAERE